MAVIPRRPAIVEDNIPLYLVPYIIKREIHQHGEEVDRVMVKWASHHFYTVRIQTRPVRRGHQRVVAITADRRAV